VLRQNHYIRDGGVSSVFHRNANRRRLRIRLFLKMWSNVMDKLPGIVASIDATFDGFPITSGARWRRHLRNVAHAMRESALDIPFYELGSLRFPHMLAQQDQSGNRQHRCADGDPMGKPGWVNSKSEALDAQPLLAARAAEPLSGVFLNPMLVGTFVTDSCHCATSIIAGCRNEVPPKTAKLAL